MLLGCLLVRFVGSLWRSFGSTLEFLCVVWAYGQRGVVAKWGHVKVDVKLTFKMAFIFQLLCRESLADAKRKRERESRPVQLPWADPARITASTLTVRGPPSHRSRAQAARKPWNRPWGTLGSFDLEKKTKESCWVCLFDFVLLKLRR